MNRSRTRTVATLACTTVAAAAVVAPSLVVAATSSGAGAGGTADLDLVVVSAAVGLGYARFLRVLLARAAGASGEADVWLSTVHGLVVLLPAASGLPAAALHLTAERHAGVVDAEWPVLVWWAAAGTAAVLLAEATRRLSWRWLRRP